MAMSIGGPARLRAEPNVTPMIDILLVLIVTFLLITPKLSRGLDALVPQPADEKQSSPRQDVVITVLRDGNVRLNQEPLALSDLDERLKVIFKNAANHVIFVRGEKDLDFRQVAEVIDIARGAGMDRVALMTQ